MLWKGLGRGWHEPAGWTDQAVGELMRPFLHISPWSPPFFQPPSVSTGLCTTPAAQDVPRPVTTGMRLVRAISRASRAATVPPTWSFTGEGASSQSFVLSGDLCSAAKDFETWCPWHWHGRASEGLPCSCALLCTHRVYTCTYIDIEIYSETFCHLYKLQVDYYMYIFCYKTCIVSRIVICKPLDTLYK